MVRVRAPELPKNLPWLNCESPLSIKALRGRIIILDFWTKGCINCLHVIPDLNYLEQKYKNYLVVIGVHTAKFDHEQHRDSIEQSLWRYEIKHPVVVDSDRQLWDQYTVRAWPTFVVIDPQGYVVATISGEGQRKVLDDLIQQLIREHQGKETLDLEVLRLSLEPKQTLLTSPLLFPGKVLASEQTDFLFIADTGHHRIVITSLDGTTKAVIGTGESGWKDGDWKTAQFFAPQGMAFDQERMALYVADTGNHLLRLIDLRSQQVSTLAGTGTQSQLLFPHGGKAEMTALNSPWDLVKLGDKLYIAMAGSHQIWMMDLTNGTVQTFIGTGAEFCVDGSLEVAAFAQPSGITTNGDEVFAADSETSSIRAIKLGDVPLARTVCGSGQLFGFGDVDGIGGDARLQHSSGVVYAEGYVWIADTYNHKIKRVHPASRECQTICGNSQVGYKDGIGTDAYFSEPSGLTYAYNYLYIADTNNHALRRLSLNSLKVTTLQFPMLCSPYACIPIS
ncbi:MAG: redoxin domain-containing protein [Aphanothece sp. CMT-3BRIN-NPC111]|jgi:thiol-disulfide isomerase/thioredoxin|nr:redoxin domain-containing protein [Aphanothece sp. CMT-3BRIN-NPC111]